MIGEALCFESAGTRCAGRLLRPDDRPEPFPIIVMAHGFAAQMSYGLDPFALRFQELGFAVFLFDYRGFGDSDGSPRDDVHPWRQLEDWNAAVTFVRTLASVDSARVVLWGTSFSGGHVLALAADHPAICAVVSQVPHVSGPATLCKKSIPDLIQATGLAAWDAVRRGTGHPPVYTRVVERPGRFAAMNTPDAWGGYHSLLPPGSSWLNRVGARSLLMVPLYSPGRHAGQIQCPALILAATDDAITPCKHARRIASRMACAEYHELPGGHFKIYQEPMRSESLRLQEEFLCRQVLTAEDSRKQDGG